jgi:tetratricopeptide (TPR) repeat protein
MNIVGPTAIGVHRLVQAVIQARLGEDGERNWAEIAVGLLRESFPDESWEVAKWQRCGQLLPHVLTVAGHAERLRVAGEQAGLLLGRASGYLRGRGLYGQARSIAEQALALTEATLGPNHPDMAASRNNLGLALWDLADLAGAEAQLERALEVGEATLGPNHPDVATSRNNLVLQALWDLDGARVQLERALEIGEATLGPDHPDMATWHNNLGLLLWNLGDLEGARATLERAVAIGEAALGPDHPTVTTIRGNLAGVLGVLQEEALGENPKQAF